MAFEGIEHVLIQAYDPDGTASRSVERIVETDDGRIGWWVADATGVAERFAAAPVVSVRAASANGDPVLGQPVLEGRATVVDSGPVFHQIKDRIHQKYQLGSGLAGVVDRAKELFSGKTPECVVVVTIVG